MAVMTPLNICSLTCFMLYQFPPTFTGYCLFFQIFIITNPKPSGQRVGGAYRESVSLITGRASIPVRNGVLS